MTVGTVRIRVFPGSDVQFSDDVSQGFNVLGADVSPRRLEEYLRTWYEQVRVITQDPLGSVDGAGSRFYIFRDGAVLPVRDDDFDE